MTKKKPKHLHKKDGRRPFDGRDEEEVLAKLEQSASLGCDVKEMCFYADISYSTFYKYLNKRPKIKERMERLREKPCLMARKTLIENIKTNPELALKFLERKKRAEFAPNPEVVQTPQLFQPIEIVIKTSEEENKKE